LIIKEITGGMMKDDSDARQAQATLFVGDEAYTSKIADFSQASALSKERLEILKLLSSQPMYPAEIARELKLPEQTIYYHMRALTSAGLVEISSLEQRQGGTAKRYAFTADSISVMLSERKAKSPRIARQRKLPKYFEPFVRNGVFEGRMVVGSPDPHGPYRSRGSEFCAAEVAMYLGGFCSFEYPLYYLDTEVAEQQRKQNIIALGGPKVNTLVNDVNSHLPIRFDKTDFSIYSSLSKKKYSEDVGIVELVQNPFNPKSKLLIIAGSSHHGTRIGVLGLLRNQRELEKGNAFDSGVMAKVIAGYDEDSDGIVDTVEILE
jgi:DNA-binding transcriptional ArsR family regulator